MKKKEIIKRIEQLQQDNRDVSNHILERLRKLEIEVKPFLKEEPEHKLIMSVDELTLSDDFDEWSSDNLKILSAFDKLKFIEQQWNDGKEFDWENDMTDKYCLFLLEKEWLVDGFCASHQKFNFHKKEHAQLFLKTFAKELEIIKPLFS